MTKLKFSNIETGKEIIQILSRLPILNAAFNEKVRHYFIKDHTELVITQFEIYFSQSIRIVDAFYFKVFLALHDIGKPKAQLEGNLNLQHKYTIELFYQILEYLPLEIWQVNLFEVLMNGDPIGLYMQDKIDTHHTTSLIKDSAKKIDMKINDFFYLLIIYYQCDAGSYTADAGGKKFLEYLFKYEKGRKLLLKSGDRLLFSPKYEQKYLNLETKINE